MEARQKLEWKVGSIEASLEARKPARKPGETT